MKKAILLTTLAIATYFHFRSSVTPTAPVIEAVSAKPANVIVSAPSGYNRWKTGPNAQTEFEPFAPNEQATWNLTPGYTIITRR